MSLPVPSILVIDSGVGALSICEELSRTLPQCRIVYVSDNAYFPYGTKPDQVVKERVPVVVRDCLQKHPCDVIVVACNTMSTIALEELRSTVKIPVVGVVPAIKPAAQASKTKCIALLATPATVRRPYTLQLVKDFASDCHVIMQGSTPLVEIAEAKLRGLETSLAAVRFEIAPIFKDAEAHGKKVDHIVLGCTHFPLLKDELNQVVPYPVKWVDSAEAVAQRTKAVMNLPPSSTHHDATHVALFTEQTLAINSLKPALLARKFADVEWLNR
jgi:glutamate racemase